MDASTTLSGRSTPVSNVGVLHARTSSVSTSPYIGNIHAAVYGFGTISLFLVTLTTCVRLYTKFRIFRVRRWDDYLVAVAWAGFVCMWAFLFNSLNYGGGDDVGDADDLPPRDATGFLKYSLLHELFYAVIQCLLKTSIALQILHVFVPNLSWHASKKNKQFWAIVIFVVLQDLFFTIFFWISLFQCDPPKKTFHPEVPGKCLPGWNIYNIIVSAWNMVSDILMLIFPMVSIWKLRMRTSLKLEAGSVFVVGALAVAASLLRLLFTIRRLYTNDATLVLTQIALCDTGEITAGMIVGNTIPLPKFIFEMSARIRALAHPEVLGPKKRPESGESSVSPGVGQDERFSAATSNGVYCFEDLVEASRIDANPAH